MFNDKAASIAHLSINFYGWRVYVVGVVREIEKAISCELQSILLVQLALILNPQKIKTFESFFITGKAFLLFLNENNFVIKKAIKALNKQKDKRQSRVITNTQISKRSIFSLR